jgi:hypothetical protein
VSAITSVSAQLARHARPAFSVRKPQSGGAAGYQFNKDYENMKKNFTAGFRPGLAVPGSPNNVPLFLLPVRITFALACELHTTGKYFFGISRLCSKSAVSLECTHPR